MEDEWKSILFAMGRWTHKIIWKYLHAFIILNYKTKDLRHEHAIWNLMFCAIVQLINNRVCHVVILYTFIVRVYDLLWQKKGEHREEVTETLIYKFKKISVG